MCRQKQEAQVLMIGGEEVGLSTETVDDERKIIQIITVDTACCVGLEARLLCGVRLDSSVVYL